MPKWAALLLIGKKAFRETKAPFAFLRRDVGSARVSRVGCGVFAVTGFL
jgi:hypothetical protein